MTKRLTGLGSSPLDAIGVDTGPAHDHPVDKLLRGKATTRDYDKEYRIPPSLVPPIIAWKCTRCKRIWSTRNTPEMGVMPCSETGWAHEIEPVRAPRGQERS